ncbi:hypothetical protein C8Q70DRAFT_992714 [Cubamyces menziesii]|nr:hypothetical protein C8Q70DRAFT_992714 [Cubamyces menziesii]
MGSRTRDTGPQPPRPHGYHKRGRYESHVPSDHQVAHVRMMPPCAPSSHGLDSGWASRLFLYLCILYPPVVFPLRIIIISSPRIFFYSYPFLFAPPAPPSIMYLTAFVHYVARAGRPSHRLSFSSHIIVALGPSFFAS